MYGGGKADCAGHGVVSLLDSGVCFVAAEGFGSEMRTLSAKDSARDCSCFAGAGFFSAGVAGTGAAKGLLPAGVGPEEDENGFGFDETVLVRVVAPKRLAPRSCFGCSGAGVGVSFLGSSVCFGFSVPTVTLRVAR